MGQGRLGEAGGEARERDRLYTRRATSGDGEAWQRQLRWRQRARLAAAVRGTTRGDCAVSSGWRRCARECGGSGGEGARRRGGVAAAGEAEAGAVRALRVCRRAASKVVSGAAPRGMLGHWRHHPSGGAGCAAHLPPLTVQLAAPTLGSRWARCQLCFFSSQRGGALQPGRVQNWAGRHSGAVSGWSQIFNI